MIWGKTHYFWKHPGNTYITSFTETPTNETYCRNPTGWSPQPFPGAATAVDAGLALAEVGKNTSRDRGW